MFRINIQGIKDGQYEIDLKTAVEDMPGLFPEYFGEARVKAKMRKIGNRYAITGKASCKAKMICDVSLQEYVDTIAVDISRAFFADSSLYEEKKLDDYEIGEEIVIRENDKYIDLTKNIKDLLSASLPMKRVAPEFRGKDFEEIFPEHTMKNKKEEIDHRWDQLKKIIN